MDRMLSSKLLKPYAIAACIVWILTTLYAIPSEGAVTPHLRKHETVTQLIVDDKPFLILGGELGNSSTSSLDYMKPFWPKLVKLYPS